MRPEPAGFQLSYEVKFLVFVPQTFTMSCQDLFRPFVFLHSCCKFVSRPVWNSFGPNISHFCIINSFGIMCQGLKDVSTRRCIFLVDWNVMKVADDTIISLELEWALWPWYYHHNTRRSGTTMWATCCIFTAMRSSSNNVQSTSLSSGTRAVKG